MGKLEEQTSNLTIEDGKTNSARASPSAAPSPADTTITTASTTTEKATPKPKRVRTGCLTCRERHLKCDEALPICLNCKKSNRECKRGMKLNFIDTKVEDTQIVPPSAGWKIEFQDESREIASDYKGGESRYPAEVMDTRPDGPSVVQTPATAPPQAPAPLPHQTPPAPTPQHQKLPPMNSTPPGPAAQYPPPKHPDFKRSDSSGSTPSGRHGHRSTNSISSGVYAASEYSRVSEEPVVENRTSLTTAEEVLFMQVFIEEVGVWMDSMDRYKHFSRILPFFSLNEPMLCNALLACGARHLSLVNPAFHEDRALYHYDTATKALLRSLQNPNRDTIICATAAVVLNVYEVMTERALQRMNHIAGARALIKECGWNARSQGIGLACFWLNVGMELLSCLHFNWQVAWNPDEWGVDMSMQQDRGAGNEEQWTYKMVYITAKVANYRASIPRFQEPNPTVQAMRIQRRVEEWNAYKKLCDTWLECVPQTMHPLGYLSPQQTATKSQFPEIWYVKRVSITARLFYHTAMCLLPQMHPTMTSEHGDMYQMKMHHAYQICGIVAHVKDRGVASIAIRTLAIAAECLTEFKQQAEILTILEKIRKETGWRIDFIGPELKSKWGWTDEYVHAQQRRLSAVSSFSGMMQSPPHYDTSFQQSSSSSLNSSPPSNKSGITLPPVQNVTSPPAAMPKIPSGIVNPMFRNADFSAAQHPYQNVYVPPIQPHNEGHAIYSLVNHYR